MKFRKQGNKERARKEKQEKKLGGVKFWLAMGTMGALFTLPSIDTDLTRPVYARGLNPATINCVLQTQNEGALVRFNIQPNTLESVIKEFQAATGLRIQLSNEGIGTLISPGVVGEYTPDQALKQLLSNTGVLHRFTSTDTVMLELRAESAVVEVTDTATISTIPKYTEPLRDTPQSVSVVTRETLEDQGVTTLRDALRNVAGISLAAGEGGVQGDSLTIRGFSGRNDLFIDGMRDFGSYYRDSFNLEQVEVLKGPSSVTSGRGSTGGAVNQAFKSPQLRSFINGTVEFGSDETKRVTLDLNQPIAKLGKGAAFRLNVMGTDAGVAGRDVVENRRFGIAPSLALGLGTATRFTASYFHQNADDIPDYGIPYLFDRPAPVPRDTYYGFENGNFLRTGVDIATVKVEHDLNDKVTVRNQTRYTYYTREVLITNPAVVTTGVTPNTPLSQIKVARNQISLDSTESFLQTQMDVTAKLQTGFVKYTLVGGIEGSRETSKPKRFTYTNVPQASLLNPNPKQPFSGTATLTSNTRAEAISFATYGLATVKFGEKLDLVGGIRFDRFDADVKQFVGRQTSFNRLDEFVSYRAAVVVKPLPMGSIYFSYSTSFNPSAESLSLTQGSANVAPEENITYEFGSKWDLSRRFSVRGAVFHIEKQNVRETDPTNPLLVLLSGQQEVDGFEVETQGRLTRRLQLNTSYSYLDGEVTASKFRPNTIGARLPNLPKHTFAFSTTYDLPWRLQAGAFGQYVDDRVASSTTPLDPVTRRVRLSPGYFVLNLNARRPMGEHAELQVNVYNVANRKYIDQVHPGHLVPGASRTVKVGINFKLK